MYEEEHYEYEPNKKLLVKYTDILQITTPRKTSTKKDPPQLIDARISSWFWGASGPGGCPGGNIVNSLNVYHKDLLVNGRIFRSTSDILARFEQVGVDLHNEGGLV